MCQFGLPCDATTQVRPDPKNPAVHARVVTIDPRTVRALAEDARAAPETRAALRALG